MTSTRRVAAAFVRSMPPLLVNEGGFVNDARDPGGATNRGVTQRVYDAWRRLHHLQVRSVGHIEESEVYAIYRVEYWDRNRCDELPLGVDYAVFDADVNSGVSAGARWLQRSVGTVEDGIVGARTLLAAQQLDHQLVINRICDARLAFLHGLDTFDHFGRGWTARVANVRASALAWSREEVAPSPHFVAGGNRKAILPTYAPTA